MSTPRAPLCAWSLGRPGRAGSAPDAAPPMGPWLHCSAFSPTTTWQAAATRVGLRGGWQKQELREIGRKKEKNRKTGAAVGVGLPLSGLWGQRKARPSLTFSPTEEASPRGRQGLDDVPQAPCGREQRAAGRHRASSYMGGCSATPREPENVEGQAGFWAQGERSPWNKTFLLSLHEPPSLIWAWSCSQAVGLQTIPRREKGAAPATSHPRKGRSHRAKA